MVSEHGSSSPLEPDPWVYRASEDSEESRIMENTWDYIGLYWGYIGIILGLYWDDGK